MHYLSQRNLDFLMQDVICKYWPWTSQVKFPCDAAYRMIPRLPVMHAKAHTWHCQVVLYNYVLLLLCIYRLYGVHSGNLVLVQDLERTWNYSSVTFHGRIRQPRKCWPIVCSYCNCIKSMRSSMCCCCMPLAI